MTSAHKQIFLFILIFFLFLQGTTAFAHSTVSPSHVGTSRYQNFSLSTPTERDVPTVGIRLLIPESLERVTPFVKPGWDIKIIKDQSGEKVTEIQWTGGSIPPGQKDVFEFTAKTPESGSTLIWKAYQTYENGEVVAWDEDPTKPKDGEEKVSNPYSVTEVVADTLKAETQGEEKGNGNSTSLSLLALGISLVALAGVFIRSK